MNYSNLTMGTELITNATDNLQMLQTNWIIGLFLTILFLLIITRNMAIWGIWAFPVTIMLTIVGINISILQIVGTGLIFGVSILSNNYLANIIDSIPNRINNKRNANKELEKMLKTSSKQSVKNEIKRRRDLFNELGTTEKWSKERKKELRDRLR